jgi:sugar transferase (PEP-CTERM system associated)
MLKMFAHHIRLSTLAQLSADCLLCFLAVLLAAQQLPGAAAGDPRLLEQLVLPAAAFALIMSLLYAFVGLYRQGAISVGAAELFGRGLLAVLIGSCIAYLGLQARGNEHALALMGHVVPYMIVGVLTVRGLVYFAPRVVVGARRVLIIGVEAEAREVARQLRASGGSLGTVVGFYPTTAEAPARIGGTPVLARGVSVDNAVAELRADQIIVAVKEQRGGGVPMDQLLTCRIRGIPVLDLAGFYERAHGQVHTDSLKASWLVYGNGFVQGRLRTSIKRLFDVLTSLSLLLLAMPVMLATALAIRLDSPGPIFYRQERVGRRGRTFMCIKFRSMRIDAEQDGVARWATKNDNRVTRVGRLIRKARIDELPQLLSVLGGEMSLVGPRPERPSFVDQLKNEIPFYDIRHSVKPGVTGWAQVRYGYGASVEDARRKHQFDLYYVKNHSLFLDMLVLIETVSVVLFREGAQ